MPKKREIRSLKAFREILNPDKNNNEVLTEGVKSIVEANFLCLNDTCETSSFTRPIRQVYESLRNCPKAKGCPDCAIKIRGENKTKNAIKKHGSFAQNHPHLSKEWDREKNQIMPENVAPNGGHNNDIYWRCCNCDHSWPASPRDRVHGHGCPECAEKIQTIKKRQKSWEGTKKTIKENPTLLAEYNESLNGELNNLKATKNKKLYWHCLSDNNHPSWPAPVKDRDGKNTGCKFCAAIGISIIQLALSQFLEDLLEAQIKVEYPIKKYSIDIYFPKHQLAIEIDGFPFHNHEDTIKRDLKKETLCKDQKILLLRLRDKRLLPSTNSISRKTFRVDIQHFTECAIDLCKLIISTGGIELAIKDILQPFIHKEIYTKEFIEKYSKISRKPKVGKSLADKFPWVIKYWSSKNKLTPFDYYPYSNIEIEWVCPFGGDSYQLQISNRVRNFVSKNMTHHLIHSSNADLIKKHIHDPNAPALVPKEWL